MDSGEADALDATLDRTVGCGLCARDGPGTGGARDRGRGAQLLARTAPAGRAAAARRAAGPARGADRGADPRARGDLPGHPVPAGGEPRTRPGPEVRRAAGVRRGAQGRRLRDSRRVDRDPDEHPLGSRDPGPPHAPPAPGRYRAAERAWSMRGRRRVPARRVALRTARRGDRSRCPHPPRRRPLAPRPVRLRGLRECDRGSRPLGRGPSGRCRPDRGASSPGPRAPGARGSRALGGDRAAGRPSAVCGGDPRGRPQRRGRLRRSLGVRATRFPPGGRARRGSDADVRSGHERGEHEPGCLTIAPVSLVRSAGARCAVRRRASAPATNRSHPRAWQPAHGRRGSCARHATGRAVPVRSLRRSGAARHPL